MTTENDEPEWFPREAAANGNGILEALRDHWPTALVSLVLLAGLGTAFGLFRSPTYTAETLLTVGTVSVNTEALPGFVDATKVLASTYSQAIGAPRVTSPVAMKLGLSDREVRSHLSATPVPDNNVLRVLATGPDAQSAVALANGASISLIRYVESLNNPNRFNSALKPAPTRGLVQVLSPATDAHSDWLSVLSISVIVGIVAGALLGTALAVVRSTARF